MFIFADKDKDGKLSYKEFQVRQDQGTEMSDRGHVFFADKDKDGKLSYKEFQVKQGQGKGSENNEDMFVFKDKDKERRQEFYKEFQVGKG